MASAMRNGKHIGRPRKFSPHQVAHARELIESGKETRAGVAALFGVDIATLRRALGLLSYRNGGVLALLIRISPHGRHRWVCVPGVLVAKVPILSQ